MTKKDYDLVADVLGREIATRERWGSEYYKTDKARWNDELGSAMQTETIASYLGLAFKKANPKFSNTKFKVAVLKAQAKEEDFWKMVNEDKAV